MQQKIKLPLSNLQNKDSIGKYKRQILSKNEFFWLILYIFKNLKAAILLYFKKGSIQKMDTLSTKTVSDIPANTISDWW